MSDPEPGGESEEAVVLAPTSARLDRDGDTTELRAQYPVPDALSVEDARNALLGFVNAANTTGDPIEDLVSVKDRETDDGDTVVELRLESETDDGAKGAAVAAGLMLDMLVQESPETAVSLAKGVLRSPATQHVRGP